MVFVIVLMFSIYVVFCASGSQFIKFASLKQGNPFDNDHEY